MGSPRVDARGGTAPTSTLDWQSELVRDLHSRIAVTDSGERAWLQRAHAVVQSSVRPVYALDDLQRVSRTIAKRRGSCSQRLAVLEALGRRQGIATRVEGIVVDGRFWYPRFPRLGWLVPERVILAWPEFLLDGAWTAVGDLFPQATPVTRVFTNAGEETLFDAIERAGIGWAPGCAEGVCDLSGHVRERLGYFDDRDTLFAEHGQTICVAGRVLAGPFMGRWAAGARS